MFFFVFNSSSFIDFNNINKNCTATNYRDVESLWSVQSRLLENQHSVHLKNTMRYRIRQRVMSDQQATDQN